MNADPINKSLVRLHFDRHAHEYERFADVQLGMAQRLAGLASETLNAADGAGCGAVRRILEIGCGTGRLTMRLAAAFPEARIDCIDLSERMIAVAKRNVAQTGDFADRVSFTAADAESYVPALAAEAAERPMFDLIVSNATFQWLNAPHRTTQACVRLLRPLGGVLAFSTFGPGTFRQLHHCFAEAERLLGLPPTPHGQSFAGREAWGACFIGEPGRFSWQDDSVTEISADVRTFLQRVKRIGAGNALTGGSSGIGGRKLLETMERLYIERFTAPEGGVKADYVIGYGTFTACAPTCGGDLVEDSAGS
ncbi:MAG: bioC [Paenibacillus sp.]|nr:bioC [Paenibacillus sp.]